MDERTLSSDINENPFAALLGSSHSAEKNLPNPDSKLQVACSNEDVDINNLIEDIFRITLNNESPHIKGAVYLKEMHHSLGTDILQLSSLQEAIFERLMLSEPQDFVIEENCNESDQDFVAKKSQIFYLYGCYFRLSKMVKTLKGTIYKSFHSTIISQATTVLYSTEIFPGGDSHTELIELLITCVSGNDISLMIAKNMLMDLSNHINETNEVTAEDIFSASLKELVKKFKASSLSDGKLYILLDVLQLFTSSVLLTKVLLTVSFPKDVKDARAYQETLLGIPLNISCLPSNESEPFIYFLEPSRYSADEHSITEKNLWAQLTLLISKIHQIYHGILKQSPETRHLFLKWLGQCLEANRGRAKLWNSQISELFSSTHSSDGFILNLGSVLLKFCKPFSEPYSPLLLKINPTYCGAQATNDADAMERCLHLNFLSSETSLIPSTDEEKERFRQDSSKYNFSTECFFATHHALLLGFHVAQDKLVKISQELGQLQRLYEDARHESGEMSDFVQNVKQNMEKGMTKFLSLRTMLLFPVLKMLNFHIATSIWLVNVAVSKDLSKFHEINFDVESPDPEWLACLPEFIVENIPDCLLFIRRFHSMLLETSGQDLFHVMTLILTFMGSPNKMKNPHLRARLAEMLETMMPAKENEPSNILMSRSSTFREKVFKDHPFVSQLVPVLLNVFVSIEMTGQSVAFEQKFQYRRPMYIILDYIWKIDVHKEKLQILAAQAEENLESASPPLFLRFINLLINDAIFLLDEALLSMSKLREIQQQNGASTSNSSRSPEETNVQHMRLLARFHNVMSNETIHTLQLITEDIKSIFCQPSIVDRVSVMLNYFLLNLVGPKNKEFKVKDFQDLEFKPQQLVHDICSIYLNLGSGDSDIAKTFCAAVTRDGRSYSPTLFVHAQSVLMKIGKPVLAVHLEELAHTINEISLKQQKEEEIAAEAPEEFLDPIMNTIMTDPVILPSSGIRMDRTTIARHLLSDQQDPFNRSPLSMDMVKRDEELKTKIENWLKLRHS